MRAETLKKCFERCLARGIYRPLDAGDEPIKYQLAIKKRESEQIDGVIRYHNDKIDELIHFWTYAHRKSGGTWLCLETFFPGKEEFPFPSSPSAYFELESSLDHSVKPNLATDYDYEIVVVLGVICDVPLFSINSEELRLLLECLQGSHERAYRFLRGISTPK